MNTTTFAVVAMEERESYVPIAIKLAITKQNVWILQVKTLVFAWWLKKHPEAKNEVLELQRLWKELEKKEKKANDELVFFKLGKERSVNSFFAAMRSCLRRQNEGRYVDRFIFDRDLIILKKILNNKIPLTTERDFPHQIEQYKGGLQVYNLWICCLQYKLITV